MTSFCDITRQLGLNKVKKTISYYSVHLSNDFYHEKVYFVEIFLVGNNEKFFLTNSGKIIDKAEFAKNNHNNTPQYRFKNFYFKNHEEAEKMVRSKFIIKGY